MTVRSWSGAAVARVRIGLVSHPNVCRLYDVVEVDGRHFIAAMEYVDGENLGVALVAHRPAAAGQSARARTRPDAGLADRARQGASCTCTATSRPTS